MSVEVGKYTGCKQIDSCSVRVVCKRVHHTPKTTFFDIFGGWCTHVWLGRAAERESDNKKAPLLGLIPSNGGGGGIRTLVTLYRPNGFRDRRIQPLCHPSAWGKNKAGSKACFGINWRRVRDLNPGDAFDAYTISNRAPSATRTTLR